MAARGDPHPPRTGLRFALQGVLAVVGFYLAAQSVLSGMEVHPDRATPLDLEVTMAGANPASKIKGYVRRDDLVSLSPTTQNLSGVFGRGEWSIRSVSLESVWAALSPDPSADLLIATCADGYISVFPKEFVTKYQPVLVLEINGCGPQDWPPPGLRYNPAPYVILVSDQIVPGVADLLDPMHKRPWAVTKIEFGPRTDTFAQLYEGKRAALSGPAREGREIWIHSCASCHRGPGGSFGGTKSDRPFEVLAAHATHNPEFFRRYVRNPQSVVTGAKMQAHPHYTDQHLAALIAFLTAEP